MTTIGVARRQRVNREMRLQAAGCEGMDWIDVALDRDRWRALVNAAVNLRFP